MTRFNHGFTAGLITLCACLLGVAAQADELQPVDPASVIFGNFYSMADAQSSNVFPPLPFNPHPELDLYLWSAGENGGLPVYLYDDRNISRFSLNSADPPVPGDGGGEGEDAELPSASSQEWLRSGLNLSPPHFTSPDSLVLVATNTDAVPVLDIYYTTNLALLPAPALCLTNWAWLTRGGTGQTVFGITNLPIPQCYFRVGNGLIDTDGDGVSDAYEILVSHTAPNVFDAPPDDGHGTPIGWYVAHSLNPSLPGAADQDPDADGLANWREYRWGSNPGVSEGFGVWVSSPGMASGIP
jgi:hypothetical protein